jgi:hypothetical protein
MTKKPMSITAIRKYNDKMRAEEYRRQREAEANAPPTPAWVTLLATQRAELDHVEALIRSASMPPTRAYCAYGKWQLEWSGKGGCFEVHVGVSMDLYWVYSKEDEVVAQGGLDLRQGLPERAITFLQKVCAREL